MSLILTVLDGSKEFLLPLKNKQEQLSLSNKFKHKPAIIVYTSGTTGRPKVTELKKITECSLRNQRLI